MPQSPVLNIALFVIAIIVILFVITSATIFFKDFSNELKYINMEIERTDGSERRYWIRKRRRLFLSLIPFVKY